MRNQLPKAASTAASSGSFEAAQKSKVLHTALLLTAISAIPIAVLYFLSDDPPFAGILIGVSALSWVSLYLNQRGQSTRAALIYLIVIYGAIFYAIINRSAFSNLGLIALPAWVLAVSYFFQKRAGIIASLILVLALVVLCVLHQIGVPTQSPPPTLEQLIIIIFSLVVSGIVMWTSSELHDSRVADLMANTDGGLGTAAETGRTVASLPESSQIENKFRHFAQTTADAILLLNAEGMILFVNQAAEQILDVPSGKILGRSLTSLLAEPDVSRLLEEINRVLNQQDEIQVHELPGFARHQGGEEIPIKLSYSAWRSGLDRFICVVIRDLTEQTETQKWLVFQERLGTLGSLVAGVAHDFNNALMPITLNTQLMLRDEGLSADLKQNLEIVLRQAKHAGELSKQLLTFSSQSQAELQPANLKQILREVYGLIERTFPANITIELNTKLGTYYLLGDPNRLEQALMNLAINARDAMPEGGELRIQLSKQILIEGDKLPFTTMNAGEWIRLDVTDTGQGILAEDIPHIFEPFFTTKEEGEGFGLGLAQTYNIVKQHQGFIDVVSRLGRGTTFTLFMPPLEGEEPIHLGEESLDTLMGEKELILVVEDDEESLHVISETLIHLNYRVQTATDGSQAVKAYRDHDIDLVISDMVMPDLDGLQLHRELFKMDPQVKMIIISGYSLDEVSSELLEQGVLGLLKKPVTISTLAGSIHKALH